MSEHLSRRGLLGTLAAVPAIGLAAGPAVAMAVHKDAELLALGAQFETAWKHENAVYASLVDDNTLEGDAIGEVAFAVTAALADKIVEAKAATFEGLRVKARAAQWCHQDDKIILTDGQTTDIQLAQSILYDLL